MTWTEILAALLVVILAPLPLAASHSGDAPIHPDDEPQSPTDHRFVVDVSPGLDTGCTFRSGGPLEFDVPIDRHVGAIDADGFLVDPEQLVDQNVISEVAYLRMPAFDVDSDAPVQPPIAPEVDRVSVNGFELDMPLSGENGTWILNELEIPIEYLKFPARSAADPDSIEDREPDLPTPAENRIRIDIDTANSDEVWCTEIDWAEVSFQAIAPVLLVHGTASSQGAWEDERGLGAFFDIRAHLEALGVPFEYRINLEGNGRIDDNGAQLSRVARHWARTFGADRAHLIAHSKGGLDSRRFVSTYSDAEELEILSLGTISSPHKGTVLADLTDQNAYFTVRTSNHPDVANFLNQQALVGFFGQGPLRPAVTDLSVGPMATFNRNNPVAHLSLFTYGADADVNGDGQISSAENEGVYPGFAHNALDTGGAAYRILRDVAEIEVDIEILPSFNPYGSSTVILEVTTTATDEPQLNDLVVSDESAQIAGALEHRGPRGRNHTTLKNTGVVDEILEQIQDLYPVE